MGRFGLEVADVFRRYGEAFRQRYGASLSGAQRRVMTAIELCRTAALGGHVEKCNHCDHQRNSYNSCLMGQLRNGELAAVLSAAKSKSVLLLSITVLL
jgi:Transposase zinc-binding domain